MLKHVLNVSLRFFCQVTEKCQRKSILYIHPKFPSVENEIAFEFLQDVDGRIFFPIYMKIWNFNHRFSSRHWWSIWFFSMEIFVFSFHFLKKIFFLAFAIFVFFKSLFLVIFCLSIFLFPSFLPSFLFPFFSSFFLYFLFLFYIEIFLVSFHFKRFFSYRKDIITKPHSTAKENKYEYCLDILKEIASIGKLPTNFYWKERF